MPAKSINRKILTLLGVTTATIVLATAIVHYYVIGHLGQKIAKSYESAIAYTQSRVSAEIESRERQLVADIARAKAERVREVMQTLETALDLTVFSFEKTLGRSERKCERPLVEYSQFKTDPIISSTLVHLPKYEVGVSFEYSDFVLHDKSSRPFYSFIYWELNGMLKELYKLYPQMLWVYAGFEKDGSFLNYPGTYSEPTPYDPRKREWYQSTKKKNALNWTKPYYESGQSSLVVSAAKPIYDPATHELLGVVAVDMMLEALLNDILRTKDIDNIEFALIGEDGGVIARKGYNFVSGDWTAAAHTESMEELLEKHGVTRDDLNSDFAFRRTSSKGNEYLSAVEIGKGGWQLICMVEKQAVDAKWHNLLTNISGLTSQVEGETKTILGNYKTLIYVHLMILITMSALIYATLRRSVSTPLSHLVAMIREIACGRMAKKDAKYHDQYEYALIAQSLQAMQRDMTEMQSRIQSQATATKISEMASHIAHDLRSPLSVIKTYILKRKEKEDGVSASEYDEIQRAAERSVLKIENMVNEMLDYSKIARKDRTVVSVRDLIREILYETEAEAQTGGVTIGVECSQDLSVNISREAISRMITNIVINGIQSNENGGSVHLAVKGDGDTFIVILSDTGKGISREIIDKIYDAKFTFGKKNGTGLGLAYCKQVVEAHGGTIDVESEVGKGTTFTIRIPNCVVNENTGPETMNLEPGESKSETRKMERGNEVPGLRSTVPGSIPDPRSRIPAPYPSTRFLIVEDDPDIRAQWQRIVDASGGRVICSAASADEMILKRGFNYREVDTAIVDYHYEGFETNGVDLIMYLKAKGVKRVHLCTGFHDDPEIRKRPHEAGADSVIGKPIDVASVESVFDSSPDRSALKDDA